MLIVCLLLRDPNLSCYFLSCYFELFPFNSTLTEPSPREKFPTTKFLSVFPNWVQEMKVILCNDALNCKSSLSFIRSSIVIGKLRSTSDNSLLMKADPQQMDLSSERLIKNRLVSYVRGWPTLDRSQFSDTDQNQIDLTS